MLQFFITSSTPRHKSGSPREGRFLVNSEERATRPRPKLMKIGALWLLGDRQQRRGSGKIVRNNSGPSTLTLPLGRPRDGVFFCSV
jgi:hypothetical protein